MQEGAGKKTNELKLIEKGTKEIDRSAHRRLKKRAESLRNWNGCYDTDNDETDC
eukprot:SAG31_NODE_84_length_27014_cov_3.743006_20_plen_54_part_00